MVETHKKPVPSSHRVPVHRGLRKRARHVLVVSVVFLVLVFGNYSSVFVQVVPDIGRLLLFLVPNHPTTLTAKQHPLSYSWHAESAVAASPPPTHDPSYPIHPQISRASLIPNRVLRTWKTGDVDEIKEMSLNGSDHPQRYDWFKTWSDMNPRAVQIVIADSEMDAFVRGSFSRRVVDAYFKLPRMVLRADFLRYMMLYELGGVYTDMDTSCTLPIYQWNLGLEGVAVIVGVEDPGYHNDDRYGKGIDSIQQWTMASARHHPFMGKVIHKVTEKIHSMTEKELLDADVLELTGPGIWKGIVFEHLKGLGADLEATAHMWGNYKLYDDFLVVGKHYLNNDNGNNPKSFIKHHFTGFSQFGWRQSGNTLADETRQMFAKEEEKKKTKKASKKKVSHISETELDEDFNWAFTPLLDSLSRNVSTFQAGAIPRVILQVSNTSSSFALPAKYQEARSSWVVLNPGYSVKLFSLKDMDRFVYYKCSEEERNAYNRLSIVKQRVALFKFLYLLKRGGIYAELDTECRVPVKSWSLGKRNVGLVIGFKDQHHNPPSFQQAVIAATPNHPVIAEFVKKQVSDILTRTQSDFSAHVSFHDYFYKRFNEHMTQVMKHAGINPQIELAKLSWSGYAEFDDVLVHGNERFTPNNQNNILAFVVNRGGFWDEEFLNVSVA